MNKQFMYVNGTIVISDENGMKPAIPYVDNIEDVLILENEIEFLEHCLKLDERALETKIGDREYRNKDSLKISLVGSALAVGATFGLSQILGLSHENITNTIMGPMSEYLAFSIPMSVGCVGFVQMISLLGLSYRPSKKDIKGIEEKIFIDTFTGTTDAKKAGQYINSINKETVCKNAGITSFHSVEALYKNIVTACHVLHQNTKVATIVEYCTKLENGIVQVKEKNETLSLIKRNAKRFVYLTDLLMILDSACNVELKLSVQTLKDIYYDLDADEFSKEDINFRRSLDSDILPGEESISKIFDKIKLTFKTFGATIEETHALYSEFINKYSKEVNLNEILSEVKVEAFDKKKMLALMTSSYKCQESFTNMAKKALSNKEVKSFFSYPPNKFYDIPEINDIKKMMKSNFNLDIEFTGTFRDAWYDAVEADFDEFYDELESFIPATASSLGFTSLKDLQEVTKIATDYFKKHTWNAFLKLNSDWAKAINKARSSKMTPEEQHIYEVNNNRIYAILNSIYIVRGVYMLNTVHNFNSMLKQIKSKI